MLSVLKKGNERMSIDKDNIIKKQSEHIFDLIRKNHLLEQELKAEKLKVRDLKDGVKFEDAVEKLHYDHWVDKTLKKRG